MKNISKSIVTLVAIGAVALPASAPAADAVKTTVVGEFDSGHNPKGKVKSSKTNCIKGRSVTLYREDDQQPNDQLVGTKKTDSGGKWKFDPNILFSNTNYYAVAAKKTLENGTVCKAATSNKFKFTD